MCPLVPTRKVEGGEGICVCPSDHVGDFVHDSLLGQILPSMLAVSQSRYHLNSCRSDEEENNMRIISQPFYVFTGKMLFSAQLY